MFKTSWKRGVQIMSYSSKFCADQTTWDYNVKFWEPHLERVINPLEKGH